MGSFKLLTISRLRPTISVTGKSIPSPGFATLGLMRVAYPRAAASCVMMWLLLFFAGPALAQGPAEKPQSDPRAEEVLKRLSTFYAKTTSFSAEITVSGEGGERVHGEQRYGATYDVAVRRPNRLSLVATGGVWTGTARCDGKRLIVYQPAPMNLFIDTEAPGTVEAAVERIVQSDAFLFRYSNSVADNLQILVADDPYQASVRSLGSASYVGLEDVDGTKCRHIRWSSAGVTTEMWVQDGDTPLVQKIVWEPGFATTSSKLARTLVILTGLHYKETIRFDKWKVNPDLPDDRFSFVPPEGARRVKSFFGRLQKVMSQLDQGGDLTAVDKELREIETDPAAAAEPFEEGEAPGPPKGK